MEASQPKILFGNLLGFPPISADGRIKTKQFLNAAREMVSLIGKCINGNFIIIYCYRYLNDIFVNCIFGIFFLSE